MDRVTQLWLACGRPKSVLYQPVLRGGDVTENQPVTIAMLDLDHFKHFNDAHGHPAGDRVLEETAAMWRDVLRSGDMVARLGGGVRAVAVRHRARRPRALRRQVGGPRPRLPEHLSAIRPPLPGLLVVVLRVGARRA
jgi:GGDEF domain-containing protein